MYNSLEVLQKKGMVLQVDDDTDVEPSSIGPPNDDFRGGKAKTHELGLYLIRQHGLSND